MGGGVAVPDGDRAGEIVDRSSDRPTFRPVNTFPCGSEPARDSAVSVNINAECHTAIASRLTPTRGWMWAAIAEDALMPRRCV
ncbi:hypothetical protein C1X40_07060 [Pseudomonas sp. GW456-11-11-14-TSB2]|nr:hypothetical protein [Pseudomonas sp.]PMW23176.1 hypothetical protein C1X40_07060 [Pseudomonas sp. GW456-11-11-14-TSB2]PMW38163.1 hypothetical protein C1X45_11600 [Pseudomonas sp. GW460-7]PMW61300.1 hypothetical protein C1X39_08310 [Pseudomonas sp. GW456-12-1-14-TSB1]PMW79053.1 hypothetical protein C1X36_11660 [Pseudomonas sp. GW460-8]PMW88763.1 hypothetical protein C1X32_15300 [Pseudomonas sp. GW460-12-1-14-LB3]PMW98780.1 hypothetical protein C1X33_07690 [Pseudomonas sp. GW460-E13]PMX775